jgi:hypothetical protein
MNTTFVMKSSRLRIFINPENLEQDRYSKFVKRNEETFWMIALLQLAIFFFVLFLPSLNREDLNELLTWICPSFLFSFLIASRLYYYSRIKNLLNENTRFKVRSFLRLSFRKWLIILFGNFLCLFSYLLNHDPTFLFLFGVGLSSYLFAKPSVQRMTKDFRITATEVQPRESRLAYFIPSQIIAIAISAYFFKEIAFAYKKGQDQDLAMLIETCVTESGLESYYPSETKNYCECTSSKIMERYSNEEVQEHNKLPASQRNYLYKEITDRCFVENFRHVLADTMTRRSYRRSKAK